MKVETKLGGHLSISSGIENALYRGFEIGCNTVQLFIRSNRRWDFKDFTTQEIEKFNIAKIKTKIDPVIAHSRYLINLASESKEIREKSRLALEKELINCDKLKIKYLILHPGSNKGLNAIEKISDSINYILDKNKVETSIIIENSAGQGYSIGSNFEQLAVLLNKIEDKNRTGLCIDTCHAWAAGYNFSDPNSYNKFWKDFDSIISIERLKVMHINNSKNKLGSKIDRHEEIDKGNINIEAFRLIMNDKKLFNIPKILEVPYDTDKELERNILLLKNLMQ